MATIGNLNPTLLDVLGASDEQGNLRMIAEVLNQNNDLLADMKWFEGDTVDGMTARIRTGIPTGTWRRYNEFVQPTKSTSASVQFTCGMLEDYSEIDAELAARFTDHKSYRAQEALAKIEGMGQEVQRAVIYDTQATSSARITGLGSYYNAIAGVESGENVIDAGGTGSDNTSIWFVGHGRNSFFGIYPKNSKAGLVHEANDGPETVYNANGVGAGRMRALVDRFGWKCGVALTDWTKSARIANIDYSNLIANAGSEADLNLQMIKAINKIRSPGSVQLKIYMRRDVLTYLEIQSRTNVKAGGGLTYENVAGKQTTSWRGIPIGIVDQLTVAEARIV